MKVERRLFLSLLDVLLVILSQLLGSSCDSIK